MRILHAFRPTDHQRHIAVPSSSQAAGGELESDLWTPDPPEADWPLPWLITLSELSAAATHGTSTRLLPDTTSLTIDWLAPHGTPALVLGVREAPGSTTRLLTAESPQDLWSVFWEAQVDQLRQGATLTATLIVDGRQLPLTGGWSSCQAAAQAALFFAAEQPMLPAPWHRSVAVHEWLQLAQSQLVSGLGCDARCSAVMVQRCLQDLRLVEVTPRELATTLCNHLTTLAVPLGARSDLRRVLRLRLEDAGLYGAALTTADLLYPISEIWSPWS